MVRQIRFLLYFVLPSLCEFASAAPADRITRPVDLRETVIVKGHIHPAVRAGQDRGPVDPAMRINDVVLLVKPSAQQQADLDGLLADQQNPSSPRFRQWLTPEAFGERFGLSSADHSKLVAWLKSQGFTVGSPARARNWVSFSGTAD